MHLTQHELQDSILQIRPQIESALLIDRFEGKLSDNALDRLLPFLVSISKVKTNLCLLPFILLS